LCRKRANSGGRQPTAEEEEFEGILPGRPHTAAGFFHPISFRAIYEKTISFTLSFSIGSKINVTPIELDCERFLRKNSSEFRRLFSRQTKRPIGVELRATGSKFFLFSFSKWESEEKRQPLRRAASL
jgi:hypothetical protein